MVARGPVLARSGGLDEAMRAIEGIDGWLSDAQAARLWHRAGSLGQSGRIVEIGSFRGRSTVVLAHAAGADGRVFAVDPHTGDDRGPRAFDGEPELGELDLELFRRNIARAGVSESIEHVRMPSRGALDLVEGPIDLLYIDGSHRYRDARDDIVLWGERVRSGGSLLIHDSFCSVGVTLAVLQSLCFGGRFRYEGRSATLSEYVRVDLTAAARGRNAARQLIELPWFVRNLLIKLALVTGARPLARALGHHSPDWPY